MNFKDVKKKYKPAYLSDEQIWEIVMKKRPSKGDVARLISHIHFLEYVSEENVERFCKQDVALDACRTGWGQ